MIIDIVSLVLLLGVAYLAWKGQQEVEDLENRVMALESVCCHYIENFGMDALEKTLDELTKEKTHEN